MTRAGSTSLETEDEGGSDASRLRTPKDIILAGASMSAAPLIVDPNDGLPRPADEGFVSNGVASVTDESLVCTEGGPWVLFNGEYMAAADTPCDPQPDPDALSLVGFYKGRRVFQALAHPEKPKYLRARPACVHYAETLSPPDNLDLQGHDRVPLAALRQCPKLELDLFDQTIHACNVREPRDVVSERLIVERARRKQKEASLKAVPAFRSQTPEEAKKNGAADPEASTVLPRTQIVSDVAGRIIVEKPSNVIHAALRHAPHHLWFLDRAWQPLAEDYNGKAYRSLDGKEGVFSASLSGEIIVRSAFLEGQIPMQSQGLTKAYYSATLKRCAEVLRDGRNVVLVPYWDTTATQVVKDLTRAYEALVAAPPAPPAPAAAPPTLPVNEADTPPSSPENPS